MRYSCLTFVLFAITLANPLLAQDRKKISRPLGDKYSQLKEVFYVLASNDTLKDGAYEVTRNGNVIIDGFYSNNRKDSVWEIHSWKGILLTRKHYQQGIKTGQWEFFTREGDPDWSYDFNNKQLSYANPPSTDTTTYYYQQPDGSWTRGQLDKAPLPLRGAQEWLQYLSRTMRYPDEAVIKNIMGKVVVAITVDENGEAIDYSIYQSAAPVLDQEALRVMKSYQNEFVPAEKNGQKVKSLCLMPLVFKLEAH